MTIAGIEHVEICVSDYAAAIGYFTSAFDLVPVTDLPVPRRAGERSTVLGGGSIRLVITAPAGPSDAAEFLGRHGDGVRDIAFSCDSVGSAWRRAVNAGAAPRRPPGTGPDGRITAEVAGFGSVRHTLVPAGTAVAAVPGTVRALDHVAACLPARTLHGTADHYRRAFGLQLYSGEYTEVGDQGMESLVIRNEAATVTFTLLQPDDSRRPGQIDAFLAGHGGAGVQHLAFLVSDVASAVTRFAGRGVGFLEIPGAYYDRLAELGAADPARLAAIRAAGVLLDRDEWGHLLQVFTRPPHQGQNLFYELIQRERARGFGSSNIRELYEAVRRSTELTGAPG
jgi:4-hydroxymandelate synthase